MSVWKTVCCSFIVLWQIYLMCLTGKEEDEEAFLSFLLSQYHTKLKVLGEENE